MARSQRTWSDSPTTKLCHLPHNKSHVGCFGWNPEGEAGSCRAPSGEGAPPVESRGEKGSATPGRCMASCTRPTQGATLILVPRPVETPGSQGFRDKEPILTFPRKMGTEFTAMPTSAAHSHRADGARIGHGALVGAERAMITAPGVCKKLIKLWKFGGMIQVL